MNVFAVVSCKYGSCCVLLILGVGQSYNFLSKITVREGKYFKIVLQTTECSSGYQFLKGVLGSSALSEEKGGCYLW